MEGLWLWTAGGRLVIDGSYVAPATGCMRRMRCPSAREDDVLVGPPRRTERRFPRAAASLASGADALSSPIVCIVCGRRTYILCVCVYMRARLVAAARQKRGRNGSKQSRTGRRARGPFEETQPSSGRADGWDGWDASGEQRVPAALPGRVPVGGGPSQCIGIRTRKSAPAQVPVMRRASWDVCRQPRGGNARRQRIEGELSASNASKRERPYQRIEEGMSVVNALKRNCLSYASEREYPSQRIEEETSASTHRKGNVRRQRIEKEHPPSTHRGEYIRHLDRQLPERGQRASTLRLLQEDRSSAATTATRV